MTTESSLAIQIIPYSTYFTISKTLPILPPKPQTKEKKQTLQLTRPLPQHLRQILQIIPGRDAKLAHEIPRRALQVAVVAILVHLQRLVLGPAEIRVAGDGRRALEALQPGFGFGLGGRVEGGAAEEFVRGDAFLRAEFGAGVLFGVVCY